jgi:hypothetical protein
VKSKPLPNNSDRRNSLNNDNYSEETPRIEADLLDTWDFIANVTKLNKTSLKSSNFCRGRTWISAISDELMLLP